MIYNTDVYLAPMAGVADEVFREICASYGKIITFTEMISAKALHFEDKKTKAYLPSENEGKIIVQIFGHEPEIMGEAALKVTPFATEININMGCPMPKIEKNGDGAALMENPFLASEIVKAVKGSTHLPVSVKIRKGIKSDTAVPFALKMEEAGADKLYIHGRTKEELYSGKADWNVIKNVKKSLTIPVIANGDIFSSKDAEDILEKTGADGIMVGRGALGNPFIFREIEEHLKGEGGIPAASSTERIECAIRHLKRSVEKKGEVRGILETRKHLAWYLKTIRGAAKIRAKLFSLTDLKEIIEMIESIK